MTHRTLRSARAVRSAAGVAAVILWSSLPVSAASLPSRSDQAKPADTVPSHPEADPASRNVVARARMLECGHQWSSLKRAGTASGTWKDFSRGCLAQR